MAQLAVPALVASWMLSMVAFARLTYPHGDALDDHHGEHLEMIPVAVHGHHHDAETPEHHHWVVAGVGVSPAKVSMALPVVNVAGVVDGPVRPPCGFAPHPRMG